MDKKDFVSKLNSIQIVVDKVETMQKEYGVELSQEMKRIVSQSVEPLFFEDDCRMLSYGEILKADIEFETNFKELGIIPFIECFDNDFVVYDVKSGKYGMYNIIDKVIFSDNKTLEEVLEA